MEKYISILEPHVPTTDLFKFMDRIRKLENDNPGYEFLSSIPGSTHTGYLMGLKNNEEQKAKT